MSNALTGVLSSLYKSVPKVYKLTNSYPNAIYSSTLTELPDGRILVIGGAPGTGGTVPSNAVYFGTINADVITSYHQAYLLHNNNIIIINGAPTSSTYNQVAYVGAISGTTVTWTATTTNPPYGSRGSVSALLKSRKIIFMGGDNSSNIVVSTAYITNPM